MTVSTFLSVLSNVFSKEKLVTEEHSGPGALFTCKTVENSLDLLNGLVSWEKAVAT